MSWTGIAAATRTKEVHHNRNTVLTENLHDAGERLAGVWTAKLMPFFRVLIYFLAHCFTSPFPYS